MSVLPHFPKPACHLLHMAASVPHDGILVTWISWEMQIQVAQIVIFSQLFFEIRSGEAPITAAIVESSGAMRRLQETSRNMSISEGSTCREFNS